jgi:hypothetical protein
MKKTLMPLLLLLAVSVSGQNKASLKTKEEINIVCDNFMKAFKDGGYVKALSILKQNSVIDMESIDKLEVTITEQMTAVIPTYGKTISFELVKEKTIKSSVAKRYYLLKFEKYFLHFSFTLYNNGSGWTITNFNYDDENLEELFN